MNNIGITGNVDIIGGIENMDLKAIAVIEIGTSKTFGVLGVPVGGAEPGAVEILRASSAKSAGIRKGEVSDVEAAASGVKKVLEDLGKYQRLKDSIGEVCVVYSGGSLESEEIVGKEPIENDDGVVLEHDMEAAERTMFENRRPDGRRILEQRKSAYFLDGEREVSNPLDMPASELKVTGLRTHAAANGAKAVSDLVEYCGYDARMMFSAAFCSQLGCLTPEQRRAGALVIDLGAGTTSWCVVRNGNVAFAASAPVGGDHVTNDLLCAFHTGSEQSALELKQSHSSAVLEGVPVSERVALPHSIGIPRTVSLKAVAEVVNARMDEIFQIVQESLEGTRLLADVGSNVVLCGGGSALKGVGKLAERVFDMPCATGSPSGAGFADLAGPPKEGSRETPLPAFAFGPAHSAVLGALSLAAVIQTDTQRAMENLPGWKKMMRKFGLGGGK